MIVIFVSKLGDKITLDLNDKLHKLFARQCLEMGDWNAYVEKDGDVKALSREDVLARI